MISAGNTFGRIEGGIGHGGEDVLAMVFRAALVAGMDGGTALQCSQCP